MIFKKSRLVFRNIWSGIWENYHLIGTFFSVWSIFPKWLVFIILENYESLAFATSMGKLRWKEIHKHICQSVQGQFSKKDYIDYISKNGLNCGGYGKN